MESITFAVVLAVLLVLSFIMYVSDKGRMFFDIVVFCILLFMLVFQAGVL